MENGVFNLETSGFAKRFEIFLTESEDERCMLNANFKRHYNGCQKHFNEVQAVKMH